MQFRELTERYQLQKILRSSRFGSVLRATDSQTGATVAVKLITVGDSPGLEAAPRFTLLASTLAGLQHPNIPAVLDSGFTTDGSAFLVLELLDGKGLDAAGDSTPARVLMQIGQTLNGLEALAARGLAHHNLSPDNVFLVSGGDQVKLLGLGTALFRPRGAAPAENARFLAPELGTTGAADGRADLYSLALVACHALGATVGFGDAPVVQLPLSVSFELESDEALRQVLERSLRANPAERPAAAEIREALRRALGAAFSAAAPRTAPVAAAVPAPALPEIPPLISTAPPVTDPLPVAPPTPAPVASPPPPPAAVEPAPEGELLSAVDDEVLNALLGVPDPPPRVPAGAATRGPAPGGSAARGSASKGAPKSGRIPAPVRATGEHPLPPPAAAAGGVAGLLRKPVVVGALAGIVVLGLLGIFWVLRSKTEAVASPSPAVSLPKPPTVPPLDRLEEAKLLVGQGDDSGARRVLRSISFGEQGLLPAKRCRELAVLEQTLALAAFERLPDDLAKGLENGDMDLLQSAVEAGTGQDSGLTPEARADLDRARAAVDAYARVWAASGRGDHVGVLEGFAAVAALLPKASDPDGLRDKAAEALEGQADALLAEAKYAEAVARLAPIEKGWPDRLGLRERLARYKTFEKNQRDQEALLASLPAIERRKKPWEGLEALKGVDPTPNLAARFVEARGRLESQLARLDGEAPEVVLRDGYLLDYSRGTVVELSFRASDDYEVKSVKVLARAEGGRFREMPLEKTRSGYYTVKIDPSFHKNGTVEVYAVATDLSGHEGFMGTRDKPLELKRKQGFERLIQ